MVSVKLDQFELGRERYWNSISEAALDLDTYPNGIVYTIEKSRSHRKGLWRLSYAGEKLPSRRIVRGQHYDPVKTILCSSLREAEKITSIPYWKLMNISVHRSKNEGLVMNLEGTLYRVTMLKK